ncbi:unnamed protein product [Spirodela intermedia]|uniref:Uncharacterized protein n=1 Tax=Spirodela intermedia TaxID=51605 RepID=A0A7I8JL05_SPIIN|nr:unnamed protein product [Spirodela intermedia]CAA6670162.1 unnamed protein product [Spirodela intermedia]
MRSLGFTLYLTILDIGSFINSFLIFIFSNNLSHAHLDYLYWLLAVLSFVKLLLYLDYARSFIYI